MAVVCKNITPGSIAWKSGIKAEDKIIYINGSNINDVFDYGFYTAEEHITLSIERSEAGNSADDRLEITIDKERYEDIGIEFDTYMMDCERNCRNKCIFCFVDQMPAGLRDNLYFKDDDTRLSFLTGSYVTLTNIDDNELERVVKYKMSPINISVHTTNPELRVKMLNNKSAGDILRRIKILTQGNIKVNCQIVLCKGVNDGIGLERTLQDLLTLMPHINSISVVPAGITKFREGLYPLEDFTKQDAAQIVKTVETWQDIFFKHMNSSVVYAADELYVKAEMELPNFEKYEDFPQLENGVGMLALLENEVVEVLKERRKLKDRLFSLAHGGRKPRKIVTIATGEYAYNTINKLAAMVEEKYRTVKVNVILLKNNFFGPAVTVTGLLTGKDILEQLKDKDLGDKLLLSYDMFKDAQDMLLDGVSIKELEDGLDIKARRVYNSGSDFVDAITEQFE